MNLQSDICIIGNGAIGKAAALGFAQAGRSVILLAPPGGAGAHGGTQAGWDVRVYALNQLARTLLTSLRVWDAMDASRIAEVDAMAVNGDENKVAKDGAAVRGGPAGSLEFDAYGARVSALAWIVEDSNLGQALDAALKFAPNLRVVTGRADRLAVQADKASVHLDNGDTLDASLLVGADGGQSWLRNQCDIDIDYRSYGQRAIVANFECERPHHGTAHQWFTAEQGIIALLPLPGQRVSLVWSAPDSLADILLAEPLAGMAQRLAAYAAQPLGALVPLQPEVVRAFPLSLVRPRSVVAPRVALVGDAAHVIHPLAGHGMNLGFADVEALLRTMRESGAEGDCGDERLLRRYARARKEEILAMQLATDGLQRLFAADLEPVRLLRNIGLNLVNRLPVLKRRLISHALGKPR